MDRSGNGRRDRNAATLLTCHHVRQFPTLLRVAKLPHRTGVATALASSRWHPSILVGNAKGQVHATNHLRKVLPYQKTENKPTMSAYLQKICEYDWRPLTQDEVSEKGLPQTNMAAEKEQIDQYHGRDVRPSMSRFHEGFKPEKINIGNLTPGGGRVKKRRVEELDHEEAVFKGEQAVTAVEWNPNAGRAGLVALGWGSGIVRVQDLAYDADAG